MGRETLVQQVLALPTPEAQRAFFRAHAADLDDSLAETMKAQADVYLRSDIQRSLGTANLLVVLGEVSGSPHHRALGLLAQANAQTIGLGKHLEALALYDAAAALYEQNNQPARLAKSQVGKLLALTNLGRHEEALQTARWAAELLEREAQWIPLANLVKNMGIIYGRIDEDTLALGEFDRALALYRQHGAAEGSVAGLEYDRAIVLRNLGRFEESIAASQKAIDMLAPTIQGIRTARAKQSLAVTYFVLARYNEALALLQEAKETFHADGRERDALLADLFISDCLLELRRFQEVIEKVKQISELFASRACSFEVGQAYLNEAGAQGALGRYDLARGTLAEARRLFLEAGNPVWAAHADLEAAQLMYQEGRPEECLEAARVCAGIYREHGLLPKETLAKLVAARAALSLDLGESGGWIQETIAAAESMDLPGIHSQGLHLLGLRAWKEGKTDQALAALQQGIASLERIQGRLMVEFRAKYLEDKDGIYQDMVALCLERGDARQGLEYCERAKSRALLDLLSTRLNLRLQPRLAGDGPIIAELIEARGLRDKLLRRWQSAAANRDREGAAEEDDRTWQQVQAQEQRVTGLWHKLLIRNAAYAHQASVWQVRTEPVQPYLPEDGALLEYFSCREGLVAFLVSADHLAAHRLPANLRQVEEIIQLLWLNFTLVRVAVNDPARVQALETNARKMLGGLFSLLIAPLREHLRPYSRLTIVPHGPLHYVPFQALFDGSRYLIESIELNYLPASSILKFCAEVQAAPAGALVVGHSGEGQLPHAVLEASDVARLLGGAVYLESQATLARIKNESREVQILHLATHGMFRDDAPLFSGLLLDDGWLTTLDVFDLELSAGLVTLSGCETGRSVVGGGDELLGLMRAFLYAGAASLALSLWVVEDRSTARLMAAFYQALRSGETKATALRIAQLQLLHPAGEAGEIYTTHPYFWAPFILVGDPGLLRGGLENQNRNPLTG